MKHLITFNKSPSDILTVWYKRLERLYEKIKIQEAEVKLKEMSRQPTI